MRQLIADRTRLDPIRLAEVQLVATEIVGHFVPATRGPIEVAIEPDPLGWRVEVTGDRLDPFELTTIAERVIDAYSHRWGEATAEARRTVWFEVRSAGRRMAIEDLDAAELIERANSDGAYQDEVIRRYGPLASAVGRRFRGKGVPDGDLDQVAMLGLISAMHRFEPEKGEFEAFAAVTMAGELKRYLRDRAWSVRVPRGLQETALEVGKASEALSQELGHEPTPAELANKLDLTEAEVVDAQKARVAYRWESIEAPAPETGLSIGDQLGEAKDDAAELWPELEEQLNRLPEREREIVYLRFFEDLTQSEIAEHLGMSQMHVSRLLSRSLEKLRLVMDTDE